MVEMLCKIGIKLSILLALIGVCELIVEMIPLLDYLRSFNVVYAGFANLAQMMKPYFQSAMGFVNTLLQHSSNATLVRNMFVTLIIWGIIKKPLLGILFPIEKAVLNLIKD